MKMVWLAAGLVLILQATSAPSTPGDALSQSNVAALDGLCASISTQQRARENPTEIAYVFERKIFQAANVDFSKDTGASARLKLKTLWMNHPWDFQCQANNFNVSNGSILKYAVATRTFSLLDDFHIWNLDYNRVDESDGRTVLDYIESLIPQYVGTNIGTNLTNYREIVREHGGLHAGQLTVSAIAAQRRAYVTDIRWHAARGEPEAVNLLKSLCRWSPADCASR